MNRGKNKLADQTITYEYKKWVKTKAKWVAAFERKSTTQEAECAKVRVDIYDNGVCVIGKRFLTKNKKSPGKILCHKLGKYLKVEICAYKYSTLHGIVSEVSDLIKDGKINIDNVE